MPEVPTFEDRVYDWTLEDEMGRPPDHIVAMPEPFTIPGNSGNLFPRHISESGLTEDRWIMAYETKPSIDGFAVVHHNGTTFIYPDGTTEEFGEYALGKTGDIFPENTGRFIPAGTQIRWSSHYSEAATARTTQISPGLHCGSIRRVSSRSIELTGIVGELSQTWISSAYGERAV